MRKRVFTVLLISTLLPLAAAFAGPFGSWPTLKAQIDRAEAPAGSALERVILDNQDFSLLRPEEANDKIQVPLWLRVAWRKAHPEIKYSAADPTGGYPLVLKEVAEWMEAHPDLRPGRPQPDVPPMKTAGGVNLRLSGAQTVPRSESDIRINFLNPLKIISASNNIGGSGQQAQYFSSDGGGTWGQTSLGLQTGDAFHSDPAVDWTSDGTAWSATIGINSAGTILHMRAYKSTNGGATWTFDATFSGTQTNTDKELIWVDHSATSAFKDNIYACWHNGNPQFVNRRTGPAGSWGTPLQISGSETTGTAIGCDVKTNSAGDVFVFWPDTGSSKVYVAKSTNGGVSFGTPVRMANTFDSFDIGIPAMASRRLLIYTTGAAYKTATKNMVYSTWTDQTGATGCNSPANEPGTNTASTCKSRIWFVRSSDGGATWGTPVMINNQASLNDQFNQSMAVDETNGRISIIYYDTVDDPGRKKTNVYYQTSADDGATWSAPFKVSTAQTDETVAGADSGNQYGDYNSLSGWSNSFFPSWTDRRSGGNEEIWTAAVTEGGTCTPPAAPTGVATSATGQTSTTVSWTAVSGATSYKIFRATTSGGPYTQVGTSTTTSFTDSGLACNTTFFYVVTASNGTCDSGNSAQASATTTVCTCTPPAAPTGVATSATTQTTTTVSWTASTGATSYKIFRATTSGGHYTQVGTSTTTSFADSGLTCNTTYFYVVTASNGTCDSGNSLQGSVTTSICIGCTTQTVYTNNFDSATGLSDWTKGTFVAGGSTTSWRGVQACTAHSGANIFRYGGSTCTAAYVNNDFNFAQPKGATGIAIPAGATTSRLSFWHRRSFESGFDGGTLVISVNGGANYFFVPAAAIISGTAYNGTISTACPPAGAGGASAFTGISSTFTNTTVDLDAACNAATGLTTGCAGRAVLIAFTTITDCSTTSTGWFLDDVNVTACF
ncbi:MAG TPA: hypothetical protein VIA62_00940 [Thermoanaerobaculia bacterium]|nr:hypothetical protein [Thermoanaerobaculia bacterium]